MDGDLDWPESSLESTRRWLDDLERARRAERERDREFFEDFGRTLAEESRQHKPSKCESCGAPLKGNKCEYCGTLVG
jgi:hypothetical protein